MDKWQLINLGDLIIHKKGFAFKSSSYVDEGILVVRVSDTTNISIDVTTCKKVSDDIAIQHKDYELLEDDIVIMTVGSWPDNPKSVVGKVIKVPLAANNALLNQNAVRIRSRDQINQNFLYFRLKDRTFSGYIVNNAQGSANQASITLEDIFSFELNLPPLPEQRAIASVLSSLDDKIDLHHRQNKTLEAMAETLFRQWFVEEAGEGWGEGTLGDIAKIARNAAKVGEFDSNCKYVALEHIERRNIALKRYSAGRDVSSNKYYFEAGDILFGKLRPYFHKVCFTSFSGICSTDILVIRPKNSDWFWFCLFAFFQDEVIEYANLGSGGTRMPRIDWKTLAQYPIAIPDIDALKRFNEVVLPSSNKIQANLQQISTLEKLRDTLLPKLMSGEIRVKLEQQEAGI